MGLIKVAPSFLCVKSLAQTMTCPWHTPGKHEVEEEDDNWQMSGECCHFTFIGRFQQFFSIFPYLKPSFNKYLLSKEIIMSSDNLSGLSHLIPSPLITKRTRTPSICEKIERNRIIYGTVKSFCREKGHGFITPEDGSGDVYAHISDFEDEYIPLQGDRVKYQLCPIPPKFEKYQAVHVHIVNLTPGSHKRWEQT